jgi:hypothetical protein
MWTFFVIIINIRSLMMASNNTGCEYVLFFHACLSFMLSVVATPTLEQCTVCTARETTETETVFGDNMKNWCMHVHATSYMYFPLKLYWEVSTCSQDFAKLTLHEQNNLRAFIHVWLQTITFFMRSCQDVEERMEINILVLQANYWLKVDMGVCCSGIIAWMSSLGFMN